MTRLGDALRALPAAAALAAVLGCAPALSAGSTGYLSGDGAVTLLDTGDRPPAPDIGGTTVDGDAVSLDDYTGQMVVVNVWGSWCAECRVEAPQLAAAARRLRSCDVAFLGVDVRDQREQADAYESRYRLPYPSIFDPSSEQLLDLPPEVAAVAIPTTYVVDRSGRVAARIVGSVTRRTLEGLVADVGTGGRCG